MHSCKKTSNRNQLKITRLLALKSINMFSQSSYLYVLELKLLCLSCDIFGSCPLNTWQMHLVCTLFHTVSVRTATHKTLTNLQEGMTCTAHSTEAAKRDDLNMAWIGRLQLLRKHLPLFSTLALSGVSDHITERQFKVFQQCYQFFTPKGSRAKLRKSLQGNLACY